MTRPRSIHEPEPESGSMRLQVRLSGDLAAQVRALAAEYQITPASLIRQLAVDGLRARRRLRESA